VWVIFFGDEGIFRVYSVGGQFFVGCIFQGVNIGHKKEQGKIKETANIFRCVKQGMLNADKNQKKNRNANNKKKKLQLIK